MNSISADRVSRMEKCPVHEDRNPSLAVNSDGKAVCLAGCPQEEVDAAMVGGR